VTDGDRADFYKMLAELALGLGTERLDPPRLKLYFRGLSDIPLGVVGAALEEAARSCRTLPTVAEIRELCDEVKPFALKREMIPVADLARLPPGDVAVGDPAALDEPTYHCAACHDTGIAERVCTPGRRCRLALCRRQVALQGDVAVPSHTYATYCECRHDNPVIQRRIERRSKYFHDRQEQARRFR
jgi:hypothetical protein